MVAEVVIEEDVLIQGWPDGVWQRQRVGDIARGEVQNKSSAGAQTRIIEREVLGGVCAARAEVACCQLELLDCKIGTNRGHGSVEPGGARGQYTACIGKIAADVDCA